MNTPTAKGTLYLIPCTLGIYGQEDAQATLLHVLPAAVLNRIAQCRHFVVETPKVARPFIKAALTAMGSDVALQSLSLNEINSHTDAAQVHRLLTPLLAGENVGLLSDAGCPAVADPGARLVAAAHAAGIAVVPLVGPSSLLLALMGSGLNGQKFAFHGYLPIDAAARAKEIKRLEAESAHHVQTQLFIETPYRNEALLGTLLSTLKPNTQLSLACDLTLNSEYIRSQTVQQWRKTIQNPSWRSIHKRPTIFLFLA